MGVLLTFNLPYYSPTYIIAISFGSVSFIRSLESLRPFRSCTTSSHSQWVFPASIQNTRMLRPLSDIFFLDILSWVSPTVAVTPSRDGLDVLSIILFTSLFRSTAVIKHCQKEGVHSLVVYTIQKCKEKWQWPGRSTHSFYSSPELNLIFKVPRTHVPTHQQS